MPFTLRPILVFVMGAGLGGLAVQQLRAFPDSEAGSAPTEEPGAPLLIQALGSIQPRDGVVEVAVPAGLRALRFADDVALSANVQRGQTLAYLDGYEERLKENEVTDAEIAAAELGLRVENENEATAVEEIDRESATAKSLGNLELTALGVKIDGLRRKAELAAKQVLNLKGLQVNNTISRQQFDEAEAQAALSQDELRYADAERDRVRTELSLNTGADKITAQKRKVRNAADRARSQIALETLKRKRALGDELLKRSTVVAPVGGRVLEVTTHPGESEAGRPLLKLGDTSRMYVLAEIYEDERRWVRPGQTVKVQGRGLPAPKGGALVGVVERISAIISTRKQMPLDPTAQENTRVYEAWINLSPKTGTGADREYLATLESFILLPVEVTITTEANATAASGISAKNHP